jgi:hypothetical protein
LAKLPPPEPKPTALWEVMFYVEDLPPAKHDSSNVLLVVVDAATGNCGRTALNRCLLAARHIE